MLKWNKMQQELPTAGPRQTRVVDALLADRIGPHDRDRCWCAREESGLIAGVGGLSSSWAGGKWFGPHCWVEVLPEFRRRGHARMLVERMTERARRLGARALHVARALDDQDAIAAARTLGFSQSIKAVQWTLDARRVHDECSRILDRFERRDSVSRSFRVKPLAAWTDQEREAVIVLQHAELGGGEREFARRLGGVGRDAFHPMVTCLVADEAGELAGFALAVVASDIRDRPNACTLESIVVAPAYRHGIATPLLKRHAAEVYLSLGGIGFDLVTLDPHRDTRRQAERLGPLAVSERERPFMKLAAVSTSE